MSWFGRKGTSRVEIFFWAWLFALAIVLFWNVKLANGKEAAVVTGILGQWVAPMVEEQVLLAKKGYKVDVRRYYQGVPDKHYDVVIGHSAGAPVAMNMNARFRIGIDSIMGAKCPAGAKCKSYYAPIDKVPFLFCCGGWPVQGAANVVVPGTPSFLFFAPGHISMPRRVAPQINQDIP